MAAATECPDQSTLADFLRGKLPDAEASRVEAHLKQCRDCGFVLSSVTDHGSRAVDGSIPASQVSTKEALPDPALAATIPEKGSDATGKHLPSLGPRYRVDAFIARGGMGEVYRAYDRELSREVAIKLIGADSADRDSALPRFRREVALASVVTHPNVLRVYDLGEYRGLRFLSMQLVEGDDLGDLIRRSGRLPVSRALALFKQIGEGVAAAHSRGVLHRDLKPRNVLVDARDHVYVTDFGLARSLEGPPSSVHGSVVGTPAYMSPEQVQGEELDARSDVYSLGVILFELLTGRVPFRGSSPRATMDLRLSQAPPSMTGAGAPTTPALERIVARCLEREPDRRYATVRELLDDLDARMAAPARARATAMLGLRALPFVVLVAATALAEPAGHPPAVLGADAPAPATPLLRTFDARRITFDTGCQHSPRFTPDGHELFYAGSTAAGYQIFRVALDGGTPIRVTNAKSRDVAPEVSLRGDRFVFRRTDADGVGAYVAPLDGSQAPRLVVRSLGYPTWSRDGRGIWASTESSFVEYDAETFAPLRTVAAMFPDAARSTAYELPDGSLVVRLGGETSRVAVYPVDGEARVILYEEIQKDFAVTPDGLHVLVAHYSPSKQYQLIDVPVDGSPVTTLEGTGISASRGIAVAPDGHRVAWSACQAENEVVRVDAAGRFLPALASEPYEIDELAGVPGGNDVAVVSARSGDLSPWIVDPDARRPSRPLAVSGNGSQEIAFSSDGRRFLTCRMGVGLEAGWVAGEHPLVRLTTDPSDSAPSFRRGDRSALFTRHLPDGRAQVMTIPLEGGAPLPLLEPGTDAATPSPVDDRILFLAGPDPAEYVPTILDLRSGARRPLSSALGANPYDGGMSFSLDGKRVAIVRGAELLEIDSKNGAVLRRATDASTDSLYDPVYTPEGLFLLRLQWRGALWVAGVSR